MEVSKEELDTRAVDAQREMHEGDPVRAAEMFSELSALWAERDGPDCAKALNWRGFQGRSLMEARRYSEAEAVFQELLADRARVNGPESPSTMVVRGHLALAVGQAGRPDEALLIAERLVEDRSRVLGPDDRATLTARAQIAFIHLLAGRVERAIDLYEALLADRERVLRPDDDDVDITLRNLEAARLRLPDASGAVEAMWDSARWLEESFGADDLGTLSAYALLGDALLHGAQFDEALGVLTFVVEGRTRVLGDRDVATLTARRLRARCLLGVGRIDESLQELEYVVAELEASGLADGPDAALALSDLVHHLVDESLNQRNVERDDTLTAARRAHEKLVQITRTLEPGAPQRRVVDDLGKRLDEAKPVQ
jgi:tetratricopeptide (TPR) repeat protein